MNTDASIPDPAFAAALDSHRKALGAYVGTATQVDAVRWNAAPAAGKWSPAEITEHLRLSYATIMSELAGREGFRVRTGRWRQLVFRFLHLPRILRHGRMPKGVPAVREIRPAPGPYEQESLLLGLRTAGEQFLEEVRAARSRPAQRVTHPFFGRLTVAEGLGLVTAHLRHHHQQIQGASLPGAPTVQPHE